jgi:hypothetical protein
MSRTNIDDITDPEYYNNSIYDYWILSSHNTYLAFDQIVSDSNMCYYNLILNIFMGGCVEIDLNGVEYDKNDKKKMIDIKVRHSKINNTYLLLSKVLYKIVEVMKKKYLLKKLNSKSIFPIGPLILTFDNKNIMEKEEQDLFWNIIYENLLKYDSHDSTNSTKKDCPLEKSEICPWIYIINDENIDFTNVKNNLKNLDCKILLRAKERMGDGKNKMFIKPTVSSKYFASKKQRWFHISNTKLNAFDKIVSNKNLSESIPSYHKSFGSSSDTIMNIEKNININSAAIINSKNNLIRIYPDGSRITSANYNILGYLINGIQIVALNMQIIDKSWFINMALFNPDFFSKTNMKPETNYKENYINRGSKIKGYVLKPSWLRLKSKYPNLHNLKITIELTKTTEEFFNKHKNDDLNIHIGEQKLKGNMLNNGQCTIDINDVNVTLPIIYIKIVKKSTGNKTVYSTAYRLHWKEDDFSEKKINIIGYKIKTMYKFRANDIMTSDNKSNNYNSDNNSNNYNSCENFDAFVVLKNILFDLTYKWTTNNHTTPNIEEFNKSYELYIHNKLTLTTVDDTQEEMIIEAENNNDNKETVNTLMKI